MEPHQEVTPRPKRPLDQVRDVIRLKHYSIRTEQAYVGWITRYILFHHKRHPTDMGAAESETFLTHLAVDENVAASTQNQALSALLFLYRDVLKKDLDVSVDAVRAKRPRRLPTVLTREEVHWVISSMSGTHQLMAKLLYGSGLRPMECVRLRVKDVDFAQRTIVVRDGKGMHDRVTMLPDMLIAPLQEDLQRVQRVHDDVASATIWTRAACKRRSGRLPAWRGSTNQLAPTPSGIPSLLICSRPATTSAPQELLGHKDVKTTMIYTHVLNRGGLAVRSPLDQH